MDSLILTAVILYAILSNSLVAQTSKIEGYVYSNNTPIEYAHITLEKTEVGTASDSTGWYRMVVPNSGKYILRVSALGFGTQEEMIEVRPGENYNFDFDLEPSNAILDQVVVSGTMKEVSRLSSPVPVEVFTARYFRVNPNPSLFEALQHVNGVRPQINCNVCNTGDIHINGMEGPYTMVMIDGMPIVSGLATVYGLNGIPHSLIDRIEVVKGPASTLYGSEAVGGLINVITKNPLSTDPLSVDVWASDWKELNADISGRFSMKDRVHSMVGVNTYQYQNPIDRNEDGFTDVTLQNRVSVFNKWDIIGSQDQILSLAGRYVYEDRWGGDMRWNRAYRGGDEIYGESIYTSRWEIFGTYRLPVQNDLNFQFSATGHHQDSRYGTTTYIADQKIYFGQFLWRQPLGSHDFLFGTSYRYTYYDDNTPATGNDSLDSEHLNVPSRISLPGIFVQDEIGLGKNQILLIGLRYDYNSIHGSIVSPRLNYKWGKRDNSTVLRLSVGNGYRVANIFTEDHAALTWARKIEFWDDLKPERSWNGNLNFVQKFYKDSGISAGVDASLFYTLFGNKIIADYDQNPTKIIYQNLDGAAVSKGMSLNLDIVLPGFTAMVGGTYQDVYSMEGGTKVHQLFTEKFSAVWNTSYQIPGTQVKLDYTGNIYSPMRLPLLSEWDPRSEYSPWWSIQNIQVTTTLPRNMEIYGGVKNLLNWTPAKNSPFIISRSHDPFDKLVDFDHRGIAIPTSENPYGLTFDPSYVYGPNQGVRVFLGIRFHIY